MLRNLLALFVGLVVGGIVIAALQYVNTLIHPLPPGLDPSKPEDVARMMGMIPLPALLMVELSYLLGSLAAGYTVGKVAASRQAILAIVLGVVFTGFNLINLSQIPHPLWFALLSTVTFLPLTWAGARLAGSQ